MRAIIWTGVAVACATALVAFTIRLLDYGYRIATASTVRAVGSAIAMEISKGEMPNFETLDDPAEYDRFILRLAQRYNLDAPPEVAEGKPLLDRWGNRFKIRIKDSGKHVEVVSAGPDKKFGSEDDIRVESPPR